jgi:hypothetical protein
VPVRTHHHHHHHHPRLDALLHPVPPPTTLSSRTDSSTSREAAAREGRAVQQTTRALAPYSLCITVSFFILESSTTTRLSLFDVSFCRRAGRGDALLYNTEQVPLQCTRARRALPTVRFHSLVCRTAMRARHLPRLGDARGSLGGMVHAGDTCAP